MLRLTLFGAPALSRDDVPVIGRAAQRHRIALLALLALAPHGRLGRDKLIATLWPESDADQGRNLLKVATYVLRSALGDDVLLSTGDELRLNPDVVGTDVADFEAALAAGDHARAVALYEGPLLDGFFVSGAPEFEQWVGRERERLARAHRSAIEALAAAAEASRDWRAAISWWKTLAAQDPYDSRVAVRLMQALDAGGNRAGALQHASVHQRLLQQEFGVEGAPAIAALVERMRREPPSYTPSVEAPPVLSAPPDATPAAVATVAAVADAPREEAPGERSRPGRRWWVAAALLVAAFAAVTTWAAMRPAADVDRSIVVLPFANLSASADDEYFSDGLTEEIIGRLAGVPGLRVISRTSAMHYKGTRMPLPEIARELGVAHILEGSVRRDGGRARVSAQLIDARDDRHLWAEHYELDVGDRLRVQERIAREVVDALELRLQAGVERRLVRRGTSDPEAYELYQRGRYLWNTRTREGHRRAIEYFERAIARDTAYADAWAGLAHVYLTGYQLNLLAMDEAEASARLRRAAERALALDEESADAHLAFAIALKWRGDWRGAEREHRRTLALNPGHATARSWYSLLLRGMGRADEALREARTAATLDPFGIVITHNYGWQCFQSRDYACALEQFNRVIELSPYPGSVRWLGIVQSQAGRHDEAVASVQRAIALAPERGDFVADLAYVLARAGRGADARIALQRAKAQPLEGFSIARAHVALGEADSAFAWLERSSWKWPHRASRDDPALDAVRDDPRFSRLSARVDREMGMR